MRFDKRIIRTIITEAIDDYTKNDNTIRKIVKLFNSFYQQHTIEIDNAIMHLKNKNANNFDEIVAVSIANIIGDEMEELLQNINPNKVKEILVKAFRASDIYSELD